MNTFRSSGAFAAVRVAAAVILLAAAAEAAGAQRTGRTMREGRARVDTTFAFDKSGSVTVIVPNGDIVINGTSGNMLHVRAESDNNDLRLDASSSRVMIQTSNRGDGVELSVPQGVRVIAQSRSGDVKIHGTHGSTLAACRATSPSTTSSGMAASKPPAATSSCRTSVATSTPAP
jgi:hypothetical protein